MARMSAKDAMDRPSGGDRNSFFSLKKDKETAVVRFLYKNEDDLDIYLVHQVTLNGKKRWVECLQENCPLCTSGLSNVVKIFLQLVDDRDGKTKTWERGKNFIKKITGLCQKYAQPTARNKDVGLYSRKFEIERQGVPNDTETSYELYPLDPDYPKWDELPKRQELLGKFILTPKAEDMRKMIDGTYRLKKDEEEGDGYDENDGTQRRGSSSDSSSQRQERSSRREEPKDEPADDDVF